MPRFLALMPERTADVGNVTHEFSPLSQVLDGDVHITLDWVHEATLQSIHKLPEMNMIA